MKVKIPTTKTVESFEEKEISLPFYSRRPFSRYMITEDETIINCFLSSDDNYLNVTIHKKDNSSLYERTIAEAVRAEKIDKQEFWNEFEKGLSIIYKEMRLMPPGTPVEEKEFLADIVNGH